MKSDTKKKKGSGVFLKIIVGSVIIQAIVYTWVHLFLSRYVGSEIAPLTSVAFYGFCGGELWIASLLKKDKTKNESEEKEREENDFSETYEP